MWSEKGKRDIYGTLTTVYMYMYKIVRYLHEPLDPLAILQDLPRVRKPAQLLTALDQHRDEASEHDADLESVCPHHRLHPSLKETNF